MVSGGQYTFSLNIAIGNCMGGSGDRILVRIKNPSSTVIFTSPAITASGNYSYNFTGDAAGTGTIEVIYSNSGSGTKACSFTMDDALLTTFTESVSTVCGTSKDYRYGFNGMESDDEVYGQGNAYTAEYWEYDPRIGRRWNVDPVTYSWQSPYAAFNNNPIYFADPLGLEGAPAERAGGAKQGRGGSTGGSRTLEQGHNDAEGDRGSTAPNGGTRQGDGSILGGDPYCIGCDFDAATSSSPSSSTAPVYTYSPVPWGDFKTPTTIYQTERLGTRQALEAGTLIISTGALIPGGYDDVILGTIGTLSTISAIIYWHYEPTYVTYPVGIIDMPFTGYNYDVDVPVLPITGTKTGTGNSADNPNQHTVYEIYGNDMITGGRITLKYGISDSKYDTYMGKGSSRPSSQLRDLQSKYPHLMVNYSIIAKTSTRSIALFVEQAAVSLHFHKFGKVPPEQKLPFPFK